MRTMILLVAAGALGGGCTYESSKPTTQPTLAEQAARDPMFTPRWEKPNISGGDINNFDKEAFKKDWDHVFNQ